MHFGNRTGAGALLCARALVIAGLAVCAATDSEAEPPSNVAIPAPSISVSDSLLSFTTAAESTSAIQAITVTNSGNGALRIARIELTGPDAASFHQDTTCEHTLFPRQSCRIAVSLTAFLAKSYNAALEITSNAGSAPEIVG